MRARRVPDVGDRGAAELCRTRHAPAHHREFALAIGDADDWRGIVDEHAGQRRYVGAWERLFNLVQKRGVQLGMVFLDGTNIRAHQKAAGVTRKGVSR